MHGIDFLKSTEALWVLGLLPAEALPDIAIDALERGFESQTLLDLAGLQESEMAGAPTLFEAFLAASRPEPMTKEEALRSYARIVSASILSDTITPIDGAKRIWRVVGRAEVPDFHDLDGFLYAASEFESRPAERDFFARAIREEAAKLLGEPGGGASLS